MTYERHNRRKGVLPFRQTGEFHYRWALRYLDENNVPHAMQHLWQAVEMNPGNVGYNLELASLLSDIQRFDESNEILLMLMQSGEAPGECFYGLGCNFMGLGDMSNAAESLEQYLSREPEGDYIEDAIGMLDSIEEQKQELAEPAELPSPPMREQALEGNRMLEAGEFSQAIEKLEPIRLDGEDGLKARNDLAMAYYYDGRQDEAMRTARETLAQYPSHLHTLCNLALILHKSDPGEARSVIVRAAGMTANDPYLNYRVGVTMCEMGEHQLALRPLEIAAAWCPYDVRIQHYHALCCYNSGLARKAAGIWEQLRKLYPDNTVIDWYARTAAARLRGEDVPPVFSYGLQVPVDEVIRRIRGIGICLRASRSLKDLGRDAAFRSLLRWGMTLRDMKLRKAMLHMLATAGGGENERLLRRLLLSCQESDEFKREIFLALQSMNACQPYLALMDGHIVQARVHVHRIDMGPVVSGYQRVAALLGERMRGPVKAKMDEAVALWNSFLLSQINRGKPLRIKQPAAWAAALNVCIARRNGHALSCGESARLYGAAAGTVGRCVRRILQQTGGEKDGHDEL